jgi:hypothetical protein
LYSWVLLLAFLAGLSESLGNFARSKDLYVRLPRSVKAPHALDRGSIASENALDSQGWYAEEASECHAPNDALELIW